MIHGLAAFFPAIHDKAVTAVLYFGFRGDLIGGKHQRIHQAGTGRSEFVDTRDMRLGNTKHMDRRLRVDIFNSEHLGGFANDRAWDLSRHYFAEKTILRLSHILRFDF